MPRGESGAKMSSWPTAVILLMSAISSVCFGHRRGQFRQDPVPLKTIAALDFDLGPMHGTIRLTSDLPLNHSSAARNLEQLRGALKIPEETKHQLQMITRGILEAFGLYEPFRKQTKAIVLNNPVYYGEASGMVNYHKNLVRANELNATDATPRAFEWKGLDGERPMGRDKYGTLEQKWSGLIDDADIEPISSVAP